MTEPFLHEPVAIFLIIMTVILVTPLLSERFRLPGIVGLILGGILIGPQGVRLLAVSDTVVLLATVGLIYLMFGAGLEVNLHQFNRVRNKSLVFGALTYLLPQGMGMLFGRWLGMDWAGAVLLGSAFSSHTLIAFPILTRLGVVTNEAVSITVGATIFTDIAAFVVLAAVTAVRGGSLEAGYFVTLFGLLIAYAALVLFGLPRLGKAFFRRFHYPTVEFQFVLVALFISAVLAELIGVHAVVGAFLAGLAINATLPHHSVVIRHVLFVGQSFFIPIFLMYSGMITDVTAFLQGWEVVWIGAGMTFIAYVSKLLAAAGAARIYGYSRDEFMTVWGLSQAQAAVTIPTLIIGQELGLFSGAVFNAAIVMVLLTSISSPLIVQRYARRLQPEPAETEERSVFERILVPIANPATQEHLIRLAELLASRVGGILYPIHVAQEVRGRVVGLEHQKKLLGAEVLTDTEVDVRPIGRIDASPAKGIVRAALEREVTLIVMGWRGRPTFRRNIFGTLLDEVIWHAAVPVLVGRLTTPINGMQRVALVVPRSSLPPAFLGRTVDIALAIAQALNVPLVALAAELDRQALEACLRELGDDHPYVLDLIGENLVPETVARVRENDLMVVATAGSPGRFRSILGTIPEQLVAATEASIVVIHYP